MGLTTTKKIFYSFPDIIIFSVPNNSMETIKYNERSLSDLEPTLQWSKFTLTIGAVENRLNDLVFHIHHSK